MAFVTFYDTSANEIDKFPLLTEQASWIENRPGRLVFDMPKGHEAFALKYLKWGTIVTAQFDWFRYLWVGFVEPPRNWQQGNIIVNCRSMEHIFHYRRQRSVTAGGKLSPPLTIRGTAGSLILQILKIANSKRSTLVKAGEINMSGIERQETLNDLLDTHYTNVANRTNSVWNVSANTVNGKLEMYLNYFPRKNQIIDFLIEEGVNLETPQQGYVLTEDGDVYNDVLGMGDEAVQEDVNAYIAEDKGLQNLYGLRQTIEQFPGNVESATIKSNAEDFLRAHKESLQAINPVLPYTEEVATRIMLNSLIPIRLHSVGFKADGSLGFDGLAPCRSVTIDEKRQRISLIVGTEI